MKKYIKIAVIFSLGMLFANCQPEDGVVGENGSDGIDGVVGENGEDGVGFDELLKFGSITTTLDGKTPEGDDFIDVANFQFYGVDSGEISNENSVIFIGDDIEFKLERFISAPEDAYLGDAIEVDLYVTDAGLGTQTFEFSMDYDNHTIINKEAFHVFGISDRFSDTDETISNFNITNYSFDETTNELKFSFSFEVEAGDNVTGYDLNVSGEVDVIVLEEL